MRCDILSEFNENVFEEILRRKPISEFDTGLSIDSRSSGLSANMTLWQVQSPVGSIQLMAGRGLNYANEGTPSVISWSSKTSEEPRSLEHHRSINIGCQQLGKEQSTQEDGNLIRPPAPQAFDWWNSYAQFWTRQHSPKPNQAPLFEILQAMMLPRDTFDKEMFYKSKAREFEVIKVEACSHGIQYASSGFKYEGLWIADFGNFNLRCRYLWASGSLKLSYMPDPLWALSEVSKNFLRFGYYLRPVHMTMLSAYCFRLGRSAEARKFYEASIKALRPLDKLSDFEGLMTLGLVSTAIFSHEFDTARYLLKDVLNKRIGSLIYADDHEQFASPCSSAAQQLKKLVRDKVSSQLKVIEWFESNPKSRHKVFGTTESYGFASHCPGLTINEFHFCFGKVCIASPCPIYALRPTEADRNMFNLDVTYPVVSGMADLGFFEWQYFWRYLRAYGHMLEEMVSDEKQ